MSENTHIYTFCCLDIEVVPAAERPNIIRSCADRIHYVWSFYWKYLNFPLYNGAKACIPAILMTIYMLQPDYHKGLLYTGLYAYIMTMYLIQWIFYECLAMIKNDKYGNYLCNVPAYYHFMRHVYTIKIQTMLCALLFSGSAAGWLYMGFKVYKDRQQCIVLLIIALIYAIVKTYVYITCSVIKYDVVYCNKPYFILSPPAFIQAPKPLPTTASMSPTSTWDCICCMVRENTPICKWLFNAIVIIGLIIIGSWYVFLSRFIFIASISSTFSHRTNFNMAIFHAVSNTLLLIAPQIDYYLHNTDPQNTRFEPIMMIDPKTKGDAPEVKLGIRGIFLIINILATAFSWAFVYHCDTLHSTIGSLTLLFSLIGMTTLITLLVDASTSRLYMEEKKNIAIGHALNEVISPMALDAHDTAINV